MKTLIIPVALLMCIQITHAQFSLGIEAGANFSVVKFSGLDEADPEFAFGMNAGIAPRYSFDDHISVLADISYSMKGYRLAYALDDDVSLNYRNTYLTLTPQLAYRITEFLGISAGPFLGIKLYEGTRLLDNDWVNTGDLELIESTDYGFMVALRAFLDRFYLKVAYEHGLQDIGNVSYTDIDGNSMDVKTYTRNIQVGLGYLIGFDK